MREAGCGLSAEMIGARRFVSAQLDVFREQTSRDVGQKLFRERFVHEQCFHRIAHGGALDFGVHHNFLGHFQIGIAIDEDVAHAFVMFDHGNFGAFRHGANQSFAAARHAEIDVLRERKQFFDGLAISRGAQLESRVAEKSPSVLRPASTMVLAMIWFECIASLPPRRIVALPDLKQRLAASAVTFGP